ncbi:MAG TPA: ATP-binding protein [Planctomycetota bacterium]|nr:ATP-binding protein [Planctomycetota bacterium]
MRGDDAERQQTPESARLQEAEETLAAISRGEVDAFVMRQDDEPQVLLLSGVERPYRHFIEHMQQAAITLSREGVILYSNGRLAELLALPAAPLAGLPLDEFLEPGARDVFADFLQRGRGAQVAAEFSFRRADGRELPAHLTASALGDTQGSLCVVLTDLTQQKRDEQLREHLAREQLARTAAEKSARDLRVADRRKDEFLAMLAHELRNPLAPLRNGIQLLKIIDPTRSSIDATRDMMERQVESLVRLVDDLLDVGRISQGKIHLRKTVVDARAIAEMAVESCRGTIAERGHSFDVDVPDDPLPVEADVERLVQVLVNLLNNAAKFTPPGGRLRFHIERDGARAECVFRVCDNGVGIDPLLLPRIFDLFVQSDPTIVRREGGLGIGLTVASRLVELHGGRIEAMSDGLGCGSEFAVRLPLLAGADLPRSARAEAAGRAPAHRPLRIVVVDDYPDSAASLGMLLRLLGHDVREITDPHGALELVLSFRPEVLVLDIGMPGMSGYDFVAALRQSGLPALPRIIAVSGFMSEADRERSAASGFSAHLAKPVDLEHLRQALAAPT